MCLNIAWDRLSHLIEYQLHKDGCGNDSNVELNDHNVYEGLETPRKAKGRKKEWRRRGDGEFACFTRLNVVVFQMM